MKTATHLDLSSKLRGAAMMIMATGVLTIVLGVPSATAATSDGHFNGTYKLSNFAPYTLGAGAGTDLATPENLAGVEAAADQINAAGGVNGKSITIQSCDTQGIASGPVRCAQQAVGNDDLAVVGSIDESGTSVTTLQAADIPDIGNDDSGALGTNPDSFPLLSSASALVAGSVSVAANAGDTSQGVVVNSAVVPALSSLFAPVKAHFAKFNVQGVAIPDNAVDLSAVVAQADEYESISVAPDDYNSLAAFMSAYQQSGVKKLLISNAYTMDAESIQKLGSLANGMDVIDLAQPATFTRNPAVVTFDKWMNKVNKSAPKDFEAVASYDSVLLVAQLINGMKHVTPQNLLAKLNADNSVNLPMLAPLSFTAPLPTSLSSGTPRIFSDNVVVDQVQHGKLVALNDGEFVNAFTGITTKVSKP